MKKLMVVLAMTFFMLTAADISNVLAEPPLKKGNPGLPGCLAEVNQLEQQIADQESTIVDLKGQIAELQSALDAMKTYAPLPQTGQETCYDEDRDEIACEGTGQDGDYQMGVPWPNPRFIDHQDGTVTDKLTGLMWTKDIEAIPGILYFFDALASCNDLVLAEYADWRMPNIKELSSLTSYTTRFLPPGHPFLNEPNGQGFWSSTPLHKPEGELYTWGVQISVHGTRTSAEGREINMMRVWPVRGLNLRR